MVSDKTVKIKRTEFFNSKNLCACWNTSPVCHIAARTAGTERDRDSLPSAEALRNVSSQLIFPTRHNHDPHLHSLPPANCLNGGRQLFSIERDFSAAFLALLRYGTYVFALGVCGGPPLPISLTPGSASPAQVLEVAGGWCRGFPVEYIYSPCIGAVAGRLCSSVSAPCWWHRKCCRMVQRFSCGIFSLCIGYYSFFWLEL